MNFLGRLKELKKLDEVVGSEVCGIIMDMKCRIEELEKQQTMTPRKPEIYEQVIPWLWYVALVLSVVAVVLHFR